MASQVVRLNANLRPDAATALEDLAERMGANRTTALQQAILLADLLYREADERATIQVKKAGFAPRTVQLPKFDPEVTKQVDEALRAMLTADDTADSSTVPDTKPPTSPPEPAPPAPAGS